MKYLSPKTALTMLIALLPAALAASPAPRWQAVPQHGDVPSALFDAAISYSLAHGNHDTLYRFGGDNDGTLVNDFFALDLRTFTWTNVGTAQTPAARADTLMIPGPCVDCVSLVGGRGAFRSGVMFPEMQTYNARTRAWVKVPASAPSDLPFGFKFTVDDGSGEAQIFINTQTGIDLSGLAAGQTVSVTGFSSQFDTHYEIDPRSPADIEIRNH